MRQFDAVGIKLTPTLFQKNAFCPRKRQAHEGLLTSAFGEQVKQRYLVFARAVDAYNTRLYVEWEQRVGAVATEKLKQPILCALATGKDTLDGAGAKEPGGALSNPTKFNKVSIQPQSTVVPADFRASGMPAPPYGVNFAMELHMIIRESKYLDRMGFQVGASVYLLFRKVSRNHAQAPFP